MKADVKVYEGPRGKWTERLEVMKENPGRWFLFPLSRGRNGGKLDYGRGFYSVRKAVDEAGESRADYQFTTRNLPYLEGEQVAASVLLGRYIGPEFREKLRPRKAEPVTEEPDPVAEYPAEGVFEPEEGYQMSAQDTLLANLAKAVVDLRREVSYLKEDRSARE